MSEEELMKFIEATKTDEVREMAKAIVKWIKETKIEKTE